MGHLISKDIKPNYFTRNTLFVNKPLGSAGTGKKQLGANHERLSRVLFEGALICRVKKDEVNFLEFF